MKKSTIILVLFVIPSICVAQDHWKDDILRRWSVVNDDATRVMLLNEFSNYYKFIKPDSGLYFANKALALARQIRFVEGEVEAMALQGITLIVLGQDEKALQINLRANQLAEENKLPELRVALLAQLGMIYNRSKDYPKALSLFRASMNLAKSVQDSAFYCNAQNNIARTYLAMNKLDSSMYYGQLVYHNTFQEDIDWVLNAPWVKHDVLLTLGRIQKRIGKTDLALSYFRQSLDFADENNKMIVSNLSIAELFYALKMPDSAIVHSKRALELARGGSFYFDAIEASTLLSQIYEGVNPQLALEYSKTALAFKDSLHSLSRSTALESLTEFDEQERQRELAEAKSAYRNQIKQYSLLAGLGVILLIAFILYRSNQRKQKANKVLETTLSRLRSTQALLVQSEKMASLGELTAGIAHEIQNPLNFVNNFSEVNKDLLSEMKDEIENGNLQEAKSIAATIIDNQEKINNHGKRADAIVKSMLQHSRSSTGVKESTNINTLVDEYLRLAYHGFRAKDKTFNVSLKTSFDERIGTINVVPQDIGRVILNLLNNAFYAVSAKASDYATASSDKSATTDGQGQAGYEPTVSVSTKKLDSTVLISIKDNGNGIPEEVLDKIFQPFFTTKPTGQGTGLGLSLSYDIVKAHGGELKVETKAGNGAEFTIHLPIDN